MVTTLRFFLTIIRRRQSEYVTIIPRARVGYEKVDSFSIVEEILFSKFWKNLRVNCGRTVMAGDNQDSPSPLTISQNWPARKYSRIEFVVVLSIQLMQKSDEKNL